MIKIFTSYFAKSYQIPKDVLQISIALYHPNWWKGFDLKILSPTPEILSAYKWTGDVSEYTVQFCGLLNKLDADKLYRDLCMKAEQSGKDKVVLLCYEKYGAFCHRHLVAAWFRQHGYDVKEFDAYEYNKSQ